MYGALYVVADLDEYLADPEAYLAKNPLPIKDELLKFNRPRTEWKFEELAGAVEKMQGRPVVRQRQADVHGGELRRVPQARTASGNEFGPDLTKLDPKVVQADATILRAHPRTVAEDRREVPDRSVIELTNGQDGHRA